MLTSQFNENVSLTRQQHCSADVRGIVQAKKKSRLTSKVR